MFHVILTKCSLELGKESCGYCYFLQYYAWWVNYWGGVQVSRNGVTPARCHMGDYEELRRSCGR